MSSSSDRGVNASGGGSPDRGGNASGGASGDRGVNAWYVRLGADSRPGRYRTCCYIGDQHPDATLHLSAEVAGDISGAVLLWESSFDDKGRVCVRINKDFAPNCPPLWFVSVPGRSSEPVPIHNLVAFDTSHVAPDTIIDDPEFMFLKVGNDQQVAAIQWGRDTGTVHQLYVHKDRRRSDVGTHLIYVASAYHQTHGWPGRLHSDGKRTVLGQEFAISLLHGQRIENLSELAPPMDPASN